MEGRQSKVYAGYRTEIESVMDELAALSTACETADIHDPFGVALSLIKDWVRGVER